MRPFISSSRNFSIARSTAGRCTLESSSEAAHPPILVRDFIHNALYHAEHGYFSTRPQVVGVLPEPLTFSRFKGRRDYMQYLHGLYKQNDVSWFTPVELFKPWYGFALARFIVKNHNVDFPLQIYEIGGGTGTCAKNILDYIKLKAPHIYKNMSYVSVEISNALAKMQLESVHDVKSHEYHYFVECRDACSRSGWGKVDKCPCFVIMLEVLDNQPHDLIYKETFSSPWLETRIKEEKRSSCVTYAETYQPLQDPLIQRCIDIMEKKSKVALPWTRVFKHLFSRLFFGSQKTWIPTGSLKLLEALYAVRPNMALIASDFSILPDVKVEGDGAPLVARKKDGVTRDLSTYLDVQGDADIFFPTDFRLLRDLDQHCHHTFTSGPVCKGPRKSSIMSSAQFMVQHAEVSRTRTKDGFNPLLDDYSNMKFYLSMLT